ncbi:MAG: hypothetical protein A4E19_18365 [Nitrospira sp. SG-bin1]|nr:MAG: hypothetical protein A4E19_18365 [Nitrospira sp. SG-bin1]
MTFTPSTYVNFVSEDTADRKRLFLEYSGWRDDFDIIIVGSGIGGGVLADDLADRLGSQKRILVLEAGSFLYPTHVYNISRIPNSSLARHFGCDTFRPSGNSIAQNYIGEKPQMNFGGRSIFWSGLIRASRAGSSTTSPTGSAGFGGRSVGPGRTDHERVHLHGSHRPNRGRPVAAITAQHRLNDRRDSACLAPAVSQAGWDAQGRVLHRGHQCVQHGRTAGELGGADPGREPRGRTGPTGTPQPLRRGRADHGGRLTLVAPNARTGQARFFQAGTVILAVTLRIFSQFQFNGQRAQPADNARYGQGGRGFGWDTVHHAVGSLRMPYRQQLDAPFAGRSVVDEDLRVVGTDRLYVCDMSVMPLSSEANPVRTLRGVNQAALATFGLKGLEAIRPACRM